MTMPFANSFSDSSAGEPLVVTSATRPTGSALYEGVFIYETDTDRILFYDGTGWVILDEPTQSYTPTLTNIGAGSTFDVQYKRSDGYCEVAGTITLGASVPTGLIGISLPVAAASLTLSICGLWGDLFDTSASTGYPLWARLGTTSRLDLYSLNAAAATNFTPLATSATSPMTWASTDFITFGLRYRMATRTT